LIEQFGNARRQDAAHCFERAEALIQMTGATVLEPWLRTSRDKLLIKSS
jgi:adenylate cyclase